MTTTDLHASAARLQAGAGTRARHIGLLAVLALTFSLPGLPVPDGWIAQLNHIGLYAIVALGLVLLTGVGGLTSFGQAAFAGIGAYTSAYLSTAHGLSPWLGLGAGLLLTTAVALVLGWITLRMSGHYLPLATIAWGMALYYLMGNLEVLGKYDGLLGIPPIEVFGWSLRSQRRMYLLIWAVAVTAAFGLHFLLGSRPGRVMRALNPDRGGGDTLPAAMGASVFRHKMAMFLIAALLASVSGWLFAHLQRSVNPSPFGIRFSIEYLLAAVLGGVASIPGAFVGAVLVKTIEQQLQAWLPLLLGVSGPHEIIVFGLVLVLVLKFAPEGLWPLLARWMPQARPQDSAPASAPQPLMRRATAPRGTALLEVRGLRKAYGGLVAVADVSFSVQAGQIVGLIGPNGAGKSTTFHLVSGVLPATRGQVSLAGQRLEGRPPQFAARRGLSRTFQHVKLVPDMSVLDNVALGAYTRTSTGVVSAILRLDRAQEARVRQEAAQQIERVGLSAWAHAPAGHLALGQQRLVEVARALASDPALLLLDEPAAGLRRLEKMALACVLHQLRAQNLSLLLVEHDMEFVMQLADHVVVMESGSKLFEGSPQEVQASAAVRTAYLGVD